MYGSWDGMVDPYEILHGGARVFMESSVYALALYGEFPLYAVYYIRLFRGGAFALLQNPRILRPTFSDLLLYD